MPLFAKSIDELVGDSIIELTTSTRLTRMTPGSKVRALLQTTNRHIADSYRVFDLNLARGFLSGATGRYLDFIGELLGAKRLGLETASVSATSENLKFLVEDGTFGDINDGSPMILPIGTIISSNADASGTTYKLTSGAVLSPSLSEQYVSAEALSPGSDSNVGTNILKFHNFTDYADSDNNTLLVNNTSPILNGANIEQDNNYRFRISRSALASESANETAILLGALSIPGVANAVIENRANGIGTFKVYIKSVTPTVSTELIANVNDMVRSIQAEGVRGLGVKPDETGMSFTISITYQIGLEDAEKDNIDQQVITSVADYINNLDLGEDFFTDELVDRILSVSPNIKSIGSRDKPITEMFIYRETRLQDNKIRQELLSDYVTNATERLIIEPSVTNPIVITRNN